MYFYMRYSAEIAILSTKTKNHDITYNLSVVCWLDELLLQGYKGSMLKVGGKNGKSAAVSTTKVVRRFVFIDLLCSDK